MIEFSSGSSKPKFLDGAALETWTIQAGEEENPCPRCSGKVSNAKIFENNFKTYKKQQHGSYRWIILLENAQECGHLDLNALRAYYSWNESLQPRKIENIEISEAVLDLPANQHSQNSA